MNRLRGAGLRELESLTSPHHEVDLVLIPGLGTPAGDEWGLCKDAWQTSLAQADCHIRYWIFDHGIVLNQSFSWQHLEDAGRQLQDHMVAICDDDQDDHRPLILICHSLGGFILKHALHRIKAQADQNPQFHRYFIRIAGISFISAPHSSLDAQKLSECCMHIVKQYAATRLGSQTRTQLSDGVIAVKGPHLISRRFDDVKIGNEVLSIYETSPTKQEPTWRFAKHKHAVTIVNEQMAQLRIRNEHSVGIPAEHHAICSLTQLNGEPHRQVFEWFVHIVKDGASIVRENFKAYDDRNPATPALSIDTASIKEASSDLDIHNDSQRAQKGSEGVDGRLTTIFENFVTPTKQLNLPCHMIDTFAYNHEFFGREDILQSLHDTLLPRKDMIASSEPGAIKSAILWGPAGFGKTEIAVKFVWERKEEFDAVFWIRAEDQSKMDLDFCQIAVKLGLQKAETAQDPVIVRNLVTEWLSNPRKVLKNDDDEMGIGPLARWLLVFDNADRHELLQEYVRIHGNGSILITTRDPRAKNLFWQSKTLNVINVSTFKGEEGIEFLAHQAKNDAASSDTMRKACQEIVEHHDGHPLALAQIAGFIKQQYMSYQDIIEYISDPKGQMRLLKHEYGKRETARGNLIDLIEIGINKLPKESRDLLEIVSFLDPDRIQESILRKLGKFEYDEARKPLIQSSLVRRNEDKNELWMHRVDQRAVKESLKSQGKWNPLARAITLVQNAWPAVEMRRRHNVGRWPACEALYPHVVALQANYEDRTETWATDVQRDMASLLQQAAWWQYERGNFKTAKPMADRALSLCEKSDPNAVDEGSLELLSLIHDVLGCIANGTNQTQASLANNTAFLRLRKQIVEASGREDELLAYSHNQMGCSHMMNNDYQKGAEMFTEALQIWHRLECYRHGDASMEYSNLGLAHLLRGHVQEAADVLEKGYRERIKGYGDDDTESFRPGRILYALGNVRAAQHRHDESQRLHEKALITFQLTLGNKYHRTADVSHKLAQHCLRHAVSGDEASLDDAFKLVDEALSIWMVNPSAYKPELTRTTFLKAKILRQKGLIDEADQLAAQALASYRALKSHSASTAPPSEEDIENLVTFWSR